MRKRLRITLKVVILVLLLIFLVYRLQSESIRVDWTESVVLRIYPVNADHSAVTSAYLNQITPADFLDVERFFQREARNYHLPLKSPVRIEIQPVLNDLPPEVPQEPSIIESFLWGVRMRLWVAFNERSEVDDNTLRIFMSFYEPDTSGGNQHSLGLQKGRIGLVNGFASAELQGVNNFVAVHEALHTLGAVDFYDPKTAEPLWPNGYADPVQVPLFPQSRAEVMGGRIQLIPGWAVLPPNLNFVRIGPATANDIGWLGAVVNAEEADSRAMEYNLRAKNSVESR